MNLKSDKTRNPATIRLGSIVAFFKSGEKKVEKNKKRKLGRVTKIYISSESQIRKVDILYHNANQLKLIDNKLIGPGQSTTRLMDQLICLDDRSDMADVRDLLEHARRTASLAGVPPLLQHPANNTQQQDAATEQQEDVHEHNTDNGNDAQDMDGPHLTRATPAASQELMIPTASERQEGVYSHDTNSDDDTSDVDGSDLTWAAPLHNGVANANSRAITRARGRQDGIIHTALLFSYLHNQV